VISVNAESAFEDYVRPLRRADVGALVAAKLLPDPERSLAPYEDGEETSSVKASDADWSEVEAVMTRL